MKAYALHFRNTLYLSLVKYRYQSKYNQQKQIEEHIFTIFLTIRAYH